MRSTEVIVNGVAKFIDDSLLTKKNELGYYKYYNEDLTVDSETEKKEDLELEKQKAQSYLDSTDWVENYLLRRDAGLLKIPSDSNKLVIEKKRIEAKAILEK